MPQSNLVGALRCRRVFDRADKPLPGGSTVLEVASCSATRVAFSWSTLFAVPHSTSQR